MPVPSEIVVVSRSGRAGSHRSTFGSWAAKRPVGTGPTAAIDVRRQKKTPDPFVSRNPFVLLAGGCC